MKTFIIIFKVCEAKHQPNNFIPPIYSTITKVCLTFASAEELFYREFPFPQFKYRPTQIIQLD